MPAKASLVLTFSTRDPECGGVRIEASGGDVDPGERVRIFLWGASEADLDGYTLAQGGDFLGQGVLDALQGQTEVKLFHLQGDRAAQKFDYPAARLSSVRAYGHLWRLDGDAVVPVANPGEDVTHLFVRSGPRCLAHAYGTPGIMGSVLAEVERSPWHRWWEWVAPMEPDKDFTADGCPAEDRREDEAPGTCWFFLMRFGVLQEEFTVDIDPYLSNRMFAIEGDGRLEYGFGKSVRGEDVTARSPGEVYGEHGNPYVVPPRYIFRSGPDGSPGAVGAITDTLEMGMGGFGLHRIIPISLIDDEICFGMRVQSPGGVLPGYLDYILTLSARPEPSLSPLSMSLEFRGNKWWSVGDDSHIYVMCTNKDGSSAGNYYPQWYVTPETYPTFFTDGNWHDYVVTIRKDGLATLTIDGNVIFNLNVGTYFFARQMSYELYFGFSVRREGALAPMTTSRVLVAAAWVETKTAAL